jgi:hypothetical protein
MIPFVPPPLAFWGSPLHQELCLGLYRAIAGTWLGTARNAGLGAQRAAVRPDDLCGRSNVWRLLEGGADCSPVKATSLAELSRAVRDCRSAGAA